MRHKWIYPSVFFVAFLSMILLYSLVTVPCILSREGMPTLVFLLVFLLLICSTPWVGLYWQICATERWGCHRFLWAVCEFIGTVFGVSVVWLFDRSGIWLQWYQPHNHIGDPMSGTLSMYLVCMALTIYVIVNMLIRMIILAMPQRAKQKQAGFMNENNE